MASFVNALVFCVKRKPEGRKRVASAEPVRFIARQSLRTYTALGDRARLLGLSLNAYVSSIFASHLGLAGTLPLTLGDAVAIERLASADATVLDDALRARRRIVILGAIGTGKTALLEMLAARKNGDDRRVVVTDSARSLLGASDVEQLHKCPEEFFDAIVNEMLLHPPDMAFIDEAREPESVEAVMRMCRTSVHGKHIGGAAVIRVADPARNPVASLMASAHATKADVVRTVDVFVTASRHSKFGIRYTVASSKSLAQSVEGR